MFSKICLELDVFTTFWLFKFLDFLGPGPIVSRMRARFLRLFGYKVGIYSSISTGIVIHKKSDPVFINENCFINRNVLFDALATIIIGKNCQIGYNVIFITSNHELSINFKGLRKPLSGSITIEDFVWIASNAHILPNIKIGQGSVIAAGSFVTKDVPPNVLVARVPAKIIKENINIKDYI